MGCVCPVASVVAWVYVRVAWIGGVGRCTGSGAGAGSAGPECPCDTCTCYADADGCWDACQARQGGFSRFDHDRSVGRLLPLSLLLCYYSRGTSLYISAQEQECLVGGCVGDRCAGDGEYVQGRDAEG